MFTQAALRSLAPLDYTRRLTRRAIRTSTFNLGWRAIRKRAAAIVTTPPLGSAPFAPFYLRRRECGSRVPATADTYITASNFAAKLADRRRSSIPRRVAKCETSGSRSSTVDTLSLSPRYENVRCARRQEAERAKQLAVWASRMIDDRANHKENKAQSSERRANRHGRLSRDAEEIKKLFIFA
jgi:hypothetical protein